MSTELISLTKQEITEKGLSYHDLWIIKIGDQIQGPFQYEYLKAHVGENESSFEEAQATRMEPQVWKPLFSHPQFQRRSPQIIKETSSNDGPFWLLENGLKAGPFEKFHILKRLEMNSLIVTDNISVDGGKTWMKIFEITDFDRRYLLLGDLPPAPLQQTLAQIHAKTEEGPQESEDTSEILAHSAHRGLYKNQVLQFKTDLVKPKSTTYFWDKFSFPEWFMPSAVAFGVMVIGGVMYALTPQDKVQTLTTAEISEQSRPLGQRSVNPSAQLNRTKRAPASVKAQGRMHTPPNPGMHHIKTHDNIPTTIQTHHVDRFPSSDSNEFGHYEEPYTDPYDNPFEEGAIIHEAPPAASLVPPRNRRVSREAASISDVMGYEENVVDEASDF